jgi:hypothetical protein
MQKSSIGVVSYRSRSLWFVDTWEKLQNSNRHFMSSLLNINGDIDIVINFNFFCWIIFIRWSLRDKTIIF